MQRHRLRATLALALGWAFAAAAQVPAASDPAPPTTSATAAPVEGAQDQHLFADVPAPWRAYFLQARRAEALEDPLARCLAYPDLPGNAWPAGYGEAHCHYHFDDPLPLAEIARQVDAGDIAGLERRIREIYRHHGEPAGEGVHRVFSQFAATPAAGSDEALRIAQRWVELAPDSGYAALALAQVWRGRGWDARGTAFVRDTSPAAMRTMAMFHEKAIAEFQRAVALKPDLIDAYIGLVDLDKAGSGDPQEAFRKARALDPGCGELAYRRMTNLTPRWGGSSAAVAAYAAELKPLVAARPLLANQQSTPISDYLDLIDDDERYKVWVLDLLDEAVSKSGEEDALGLAADVRLNIKGARRDPDRAYAELLQIGRFKERSAWADGQLGWFLVRRDPAWAVRVVRHGLDRDPGRAWLHYLMGAAGYNTHAFDEAEKHYLLAAVHDAYSLPALRELSEMWLTGAQLPPAAAAARAQPFIDRLLAEHPDDGRGLYLRMLAHAMQDPRRGVDIEEVEAFLDKADPTDPWQKERADAIRRGLAASAPGAGPAAPDAKARKPR